MVVDRRAMLCLFCGSLAGCGAKSGPCIDDPLIPTGVTAGLKKRRGAIQLAFNTIAGVPPSPAKPIVSMETEFAVDGWAIDPVAKNVGSSVEVAIDGLPFTTEDHRPRFDVGQAFAITAYNYSGFLFSIPARLIRRGSHTFTVRLVALNGKSYIESNSIAFDVE